MALGEGEGEVFAVGESMIIERRRVIEQGGSSSTTVATDEEDLERSLGV